MSSTTQRATFTAPAISCGHCVATIEEVVGAIDGIAHVTADAGTKRVQVSFDPNRVSLARIEGVLDETGYPVAK